MRWPKSCASYSGRCATYTDPTHKVTPGAIPDRGRERRLPRRRDPRGPGRCAPCAVRSTPPAAGHHLWRPYERLASRLGCGSGLLSPASQARPLVGLSVPAKAGSTATAWPHLSSDRRCKQVSPSRRIRRPPSPRPRGPVARSDRTWNQLGRAGLLCLRTYGSSGRRGPNRVGDPAARLGHQSRDRPSA